MPPCLGFTWVLWIQSQVLVFMRQAPYQLTHLSSPRDEPFNKPLIFKTKFRGLNHNLSLLNVFYGSPDLVSAGQVCAGKVPLHSYLQLSQVHWPMTEQGLPSDISQDQRKNKMALFLCHCVLRRENSRLNSSLLASVVCWGCPALSHL